MADRGKIKLLREKLSLNEGITKRQQEKLAQVQALLKGAQLDYFRQSSLLCILHTISRTNDTLLHHMSTLQAQYHFKDILAYDDSYWEQLNHWTTADKNDVISNIKELASEECIQIAQWLDRGFNSSLSEVQLQKVSSLVKEKCEEVKRREELLIKIKQDIQTKKIEHYKVLCECCHLLCKLINEYQVNYLVREKESVVNHLTSKTQALDLKLQVIQLEILIATYTHDKNTALKEIRSYLLSAQQQLELQLISSRQRLEQYKSLGPSYMSLADEYHYIMSEIENKKWSLRELGHTSGRTTPTVS